MEPIESWAHQFHERTSLFINVVGTAIQRTRGLLDRGVPTWLVYKVLANIVLDGHILTHDDTSDFSLQGVGLLTWVPHRFGALGQARPRDVSIRLRREVSGCVNLRELFSSSAEYRRYGFRGIRKEEAKGTLRFLFPEFISLADRKALGPEIVTLDELYYIEQLSELYSHPELSEDELVALASCRTATAAYYSILACYLNWRMALLDALGLVHQDGLDRGRPRQLFQYAHRDIEEAQRKARLLDEVDRHREKLRDLARASELRDAIAPAVEPTGDRCVAREHLDQLLAAVARAAALDSCVKSVRDRAVAETGSWRGFDRMEADALQADLAAKRLGDLLLRNDFSGALSVIEQWIRRERDRSRAFLPGRDLPGSLGEYYSWFFEERYFLPSERFTGIH